jgi:hypothetical protein
LLAFRISQGEVSFEKEIARRVPGELHPHAWERFERAAGVVARSLPQHREKLKKKTRAKKKVKRG